MRWPRLVSVGILALVVAMVGGCVWLLVDHHPGRGTAVAFAGLGAVGVFTTVLGAVVAWRVPDNPVGVLLTWAGGMVVFFSALDVYYTCAVRDPGALPLDNRVVAVLNESAWWLFVAVALLLLYFPDGRLPSARWRFVPPALVGLCAAQQAYGAVDSQPYLAPLQDMPHAWGPPSLAVEIAGNVAFAAMLALLLASGVSVVIRYRRSSGQPRAQLKWLALAGLAGVIFPFVCLAEIVITGSTGPVATVEGIAALVLLPASVAIAMLRHDLYDVDRVVADTVSYAVVVVVLLGTYALLALGLGLVVGRGSAAAAAGATAVCALLLVAPAHAPATPGRPSSVPAAQGSSRWRSRTCNGACTPRARSRRSWSPCSVRRCATHICESACWCPAQPGSSTPTGCRWSTTGWCR